VLERERKEEREKEREREMIVGTNSGWYFPLRVNLRQRDGNTNLLKIIIHFKNRLKWKQSNIYEFT
jgi:hypothetical protein